MDKLKIFLCTTAPAKNYRSWSNIPYLLQKNLEKKGYSVENYVMREWEPFKTIFNLPLRVLNKFFKLDSKYFYVRTPFHYFTTYLYSYYIRLVSDKNDVMVVQGFSYPLRNGKNKQIIIGDWPSEYLYEKFLKRGPSGLERKSIDRENQVIEAADAVVTLFPNVREYMLRKFDNKNIYYFGNVVNVDDDVLVPENIRERKLNSRKFLFIGQPFYLAGALELIAAAYSLRQQGVECEVEIIGIDRELIHLNYDWLHIHGYLDKQKPLEKKKYYELLSDARLLVNTTPGWSGFQALLEAMYFYNPIVVRNNESLSSYFSNLENVALILEEKGLDLKTLLLGSLSDSLKYQIMSDAARSSVEASTWENLTSNLIDLF